MEAYQKTFSQVQHELSVNDQGLSPKEALIRMQKYGKNEIIASKQPSVFSIFIDQFSNYFNCCSFDIRVYWRN